MDKKAYYIIAAILFITSIIIVYIKMNANPFEDLMSNEQSVSESINDQRPLPTERNLPTMTIKDQQIYVEVANDNASRSRGLSGRENMPEDQGMLFLYDKETIPEFWMYDMRFDLDMIWINNGNVVDITENVPAPQPETSIEELPKYYPVQSVNAILEVNAGFVEKHNIQIGDTVILPEGEEM